MVEVRSNYGVCRSELELIRARPEQKRALGNAGGTRR
jgi:hypothetical protein